MARMLAADQLERGQLRLAGSALLEKRYRQEIWPQDDGMNRTVRDGQASPPFTCRDPVCCDRFQGDVPRTLFGPRFLQHGAGKSLD
jgi:hypothetical protein